MPHSIHSIPGLVPGDIAAILTLYFMGVCPVHVALVCRSVTTSFTNDFLQAAALEDVYFTEGGTTHILLWPNMCCLHVRSLLMDHLGQAVVLKDIMFVPRVPAPGSCEEVLLWK